jgi:hypothetical protein
VAKLETKIASLEMRCSPQARVLLNSLSLDSLYPKLIRALCTTQGELSYRDIEDTFVSVCYGKRLRRSDTDTGILRRPPVGMRR